MFRRYVPEQTVGEPVDWKRVKARRSTIGRRIEWNVSGWIGKRSGIVEAVDHKNVLIDGDWHWAPDMLNVRVTPNSEENSNA